MLETERKEQAILRILAKVEAAYSSSDWATSNKTPYYPRTYLAEANGLSLGVCRAHEERWLTVNGDRILDPRANLLAERIFSHIGEKAQAEQNQKLQEYLAQDITKPEIFKLEDAEILGLRFDAAKAVCERIVVQLPVAVRFKSVPYLLSLETGVEEVSYLQFTLGDFPSSVRVDPEQAKELLKLVEAEYARRALDVKERLFRELEQLVPGDSSGVSIESDLYQTARKLRFNYSSDKMLRRDQVEVDLSVDAENGQLEVAFRGLEIPPPGCMMFGRVNFNPNILELLSAKYLEVCKHFADKVVAKKEELKSLLDEENLSVQTLTDSGFVPQLCDGSDKHDHYYSNPGLGPTFRIKSPIPGVSKTSLGMIVTREDSQKLLGVQYHDFKIRFFVHGIPGVNALYSKALGPEFIEGQLAEKLHNLLTKHLVKTKESAGARSKE